MVCEEFAGGTYQIPQPLVVGERKVRLPKTAFPGCISNHIIYIHYQCSVHHLLCDRGEVKNSLGQVHSKYVWAAAMTKCTLYFEAVFQSDSFDGHATRQYRLPVGEVQQTRRLIASASEDTPSLTPVLQSENRRVSSSTRSVSHLHSFAV